MIPPGRNDVCNDSEYNIAVENESLVEEAPTLWRTTQTRDLATE